MKRPLVVLMLAAVAAAPPAFSQSLSAALGATKLDGLTNMVNCQNQTIGYREHLIADRIAARVAKTTDLTPQERERWAAEVRALRAVTPKTPQYVAPDPKNSQHFLDGLTDKEQVSINTMAQRFGQEIHLQCEHKYGGMARYSNDPNLNHKNQEQYEAGLRSGFVTPIDIATIPVTPLERPKTAAEIQAERRAQRAAQQRTMQSKMTECMAAAKGVRLSLMADYMQRDLDKAQGLSAKDRADFEADIKATREAAAKGLDVIPPVDPANPYRAMTRLSSQEQVQLATEAGTRMATEMQKCATAH